MNNIKNNLDLLKKKLKMFLLKIKSHLKTLKS